MEGRRAGRAGGPCCQMKKLNFLRADELHRRACCTTGRASGLHSKLVCGKGRAGGLPFSAARPSVFCAARQKFTFFIWKHGPPARPARPSVFCAAVLWGYWNLMIRSDPKNFSSIRIRSWSEKYAQNIIRSWSENPKPSYQSPVTITLLCHICSI